MIVRLRCLTLLAAILSIPLSSVYAIAASDIPSDTPVSSLVASAKENLAKGAPNDALVYFDLAISRDPSNYLTIFQRGATYLSLGRNTQASADFDRVLELKPDFEGALLQRAKIKAKNADWTGAKHDYIKAGKTRGEEIAQLEEAQGAALLATEAEKKGDWEACVSQAGVAIMTASTTLWLRQMRARCRFERGEVREGVNDLAHVLQISPGLVQPHLQMSSEFFYSLGDTEKGVAQMRKCLHSDPDSNPCSKLFRREKQLAKMLENVNTAFEKRQFSKAANYLVGGKDGRGLLQEVKDDIAAFKSDSTIHPSSHSMLYTTLVEQTCEAFREMKSAKNALKYCTEALEINPDSLHGLLDLAQRQLDSESYEDAIRTLNKAKDAHPDSAANKINHLLNEAQTLLKRSKTKDYYKVLGVDRKADDKTIKRAYRQLTKQHHPDKAQAQGVTKEDAEKKMASINEAYEVLSDPELKARFDRGDDPNDQSGGGGGAGNPFHGSPFGHGPGGQPVFFRSGGGGGGGGGQQQQFHFKFGGGEGGFPFGAGGGFPFG